MSLICLIHTCLFKLTGQKMSLICLIHTCLFKLTGQHRELSTSFQMISIFTAKASHKNAEKPSRSNIYEPVRKLWNEMRYVSEKIN
jgi:hypothetical protein